MNFKGFYLWFCDNHVRIPAILWQLRKRVSESSADGQPARKDSRWPCDYSRVCWVDIRSLEFLLNLASTDF